MEFRSYIDDGTDSQFMFGDSIFVVPKINDPTYRQ
jgi:hypothetical protein